MRAAAPARPAVAGPASGGLAGRRAMTRWAWRLLRREWRQQALLVALLSLSVAAAAFTVPAAYSLAATPGPQFGSASYLLQFAEASPATVAADIAQARRWFGTIQVIGRQFVPLPGSAQNLEFRAENPRGPYVGPMLALVRGRYPARAGEVAVTAGVAQDLGLHIGSRLALGGRQRTVTGMVENPSELTDQFALVTPSSAGPPRAATVLLDTTHGRFAAFRTAFHGPLASQVRGASTQGKVAALALALVAILMLLVSLVAAAGFAVVAARRQRQLGMLAAIGATRRQLRMVMVAGGAIAGAVAAAAGTLAGLAAWVAVAPGLDAYANFRIDRFAVPWALVALGMLLAVVTATGAAWWPARTAARLPITLALSARPPRPRPARRPALAATLLIAAGVSCLVAARQSRPPLIIVGALAMALGVLFLSPLAIRAVGRVSGRAPVAIRLALRDLARHQARSGAALGAISLTAGITVAIIVSSAADVAATVSNLPGTQAMVWIGQPEAADALVPVRTPAQLSVMTAAVRRIAASLRHATVVPFEMPVSPAGRSASGSQATQAGHSSVLVASLGIPESDSAVGRGASYHSIPMYVATPTLLHQLGISPASVSPATRFVTVQAGPLALIGSTAVTTATHVQRFRGPAFTSEPTSLITASGLRTAGWSQVPTGWLIDASQPLTAAQVAAARQVAAGAGVAVETRNTHASLTAVSGAATAAGALLALGVLAMTVGLIRAEAAGDLRTLTATGATSSTRRALTAATAGALALLGTLAGGAGAYLALIAAHQSDPGVLGHVPVRYLVVTVVGVPVVAAVAGWLLAGRRPPSIARRLLE